MLDDFIILQKKKNENKRIDIDLFFLFLEPNKTKQNQYNDIRITTPQRNNNNYAHFFSLNNIYESQNTYIYCCKIKKLIKIEMENVKFQEN